MPTRSAKAKLFDVREDHNPSNCAVVRRIEVREDRNGDLKLVGYASTFEEYEMYGGPEHYGWIEKIDRNAFTKTLSQKPDLQLLINHDGMPLARTVSGNLKLSVDDGGLKVEATLDRTDPDVQRLIPKMMRGDMDQMSFAFRVLGQEWKCAPGYEDDPMSYRLITEISLQRGDVSIVNYGANPTTHADLVTVGQAVGALADPAEFAEVRAADLEQLDAEEVDAAIANLETLRKSLKAGTTEVTHDVPANKIETVGAAARRHLQVARGADLRISDSLRVEVTGEADNPEVRVYDASGKLGADICTALANEVRAAMRGERHAVTSAAPTAVAGGDGEKIKLSDAHLLVGRTARTAQLRKEAGIPEPTISLAEARTLAPADA